MLRPCRTTKTKRPGLSEDESRANILSWSRSNLTGRVNPAHLVEPPAIS
jgi:hypothetical protein